MHCLPPIDREASLAPWDISTIFLLRPQGFRPVVPLDRASDRAAQSQIAALLFRETISAPFVSCTVAQLYARFHWAPADAKPPWPPSGWGCRGKVDDSRVRNVPGASHWIREPSGCRQSASHRVTLKDNRSSRWDSPAGVGCAPPSPFPRACPYH